MKYSIVSMISLALVAITSAFLILIMIVSFGDVTMRTFAKPIPGAYEVTEIAVGAMVFAALPIVTLKQHHVSVTLLSSITARLVWLRVLVRISSHGVTALAFAYLGYRLWLLGNDFHDTGATAIFANFPLAPFAWFAAIMCWLSAAFGLISASDPSKMQEN